MKLEKIVRKDIVKQSKNGKDYHPSYYMLVAEKFEDGINAKFLINFANYKDAWLADKVCDVKVLDGKEKHD